MEFAKTEAVLQHVDQHLEPALERLARLIAYRSVSTDPAFAQQCLDCASHLAQELTALGFDARVSPTKGLPMVVAHIKRRAGVPHVLFYGHYDVQPAGTDSEWHSPPFELTRVTKGGEVQLVGRGTSDDKGQFMTFIEACRAWLAEGGLPVDVSILLEGEEETGSPSLIPFLEAHKDEFQADTILVCDTTMWDESTPSITTMMRGLVSDEVVIETADHDLHSGYYGGSVPNAAVVLTRILGALHDAEGRVTIPGFYHAVEEPSSTRLAAWDALGVSEESFLAAVGAKSPGGERSRPLLQRRWSRPTAEINGIVSGYNGQGTMAVIPARAAAKVGFRLVSGMKPEDIRETFRTFVRERLPDGCKVQFTAHGSAQALELDEDFPPIRAVAEALRMEWGKPCALIAMGGAIPIVGEFRRVLGAESVLVGFSLADDHVHAPNEKYNLTSFHKGIRSWVRILEGLSHQQSSALSPA